MRYKKNKMTIKYVINLMLENRSFDQIYGYRNKEELEQNYNYYNGKKYQPKEIPYFNGEGYGRFSHQASLYSINTPAEDKIVSCGGFVYANQSYTYIPITDSPNPPDMVIGYFPLIPIFDFLANNYILCDNYYSSLPGQTDPNRFFSLSGTSKGQVNDYLTSLYMKEVVPQTQKTILTELIDSGYTCNVYSNTNTPESLYMLRHLDYLEHYKSMDEFFEDVKNSNLPFFSYLEPAYEITNIVGRDTNDYNMRLVESVYNAIRKNENIWNNCLLIINFDEHGGYYDHKLPPKTVAPDEHTDLFNFRQYGVRVPCLIISPYVGKGLDHTVYDHASVLATIERLCHIKPLTKRDESAHTFIHLLDDEHLKEYDRPVFSENIYEFPYPEITIEGVAQLVGAFALIICKLYNSKEPDKKDMLEHTGYRLLSFITHELLNNTINKESNIFKNLLFIKEIKSEAKKLDNKIWDILDDTNIKKIENKVVYKLYKYFKKCPMHKYHDVLYHLHTSIDKFLHI